MAIVVPTVAEFKQALMEKINALDGIKTEGVDLFAVEDFGDAHDLAETPTFGITYEGSGINENQAESKHPGAISVALVTLYFAVIVVVEYTGGADQGSVSDATGVLDEMRTAIHGYRGIGSRVWMFNGESPYKNAGEGRVYYIQNWKIDIPLIGTSTT